MVGYLCSIDGKSREKHGMIKSFAKCVRTLLHEHAVVSPKVKLAGEEEENQRRIHDIYSTSNSGSINSIYPLSEAFPPIKHSFPEPLLHLEHLDQGREVAPFRGMFSLTVTQSSSSGRINLRIILRLFRRHVNNIFLTRKLDLTHKQHEMRKSLFYPLLSSSSPAPPSSCFLRLIEMWGWQLLLAFRSWSRSLASRPLSRLIPTVRLSTRI